MNMWVCEVCGKNDTPESNICKIPGHENKFGLGECVVCKRWTPFNLMDKKDAVK